MMRIVLVCALALTLGACSSGMRYAMDEYSGVAVREVAMADDTYRVFDRPEANKMMVTSSISSAAAQGFGKGLFFGGLDTTPPKPLFEGAAREHLRQTGRETCRIIDAYILVQPQFEVKYDCTPVAAAPPRGRGAPPPVAVRPPVAPVMAPVPAPVEPEPVLSESDRALNARN